MSTTPSLSRRAFIATSSALALNFSLHGPKGVALAQEARRLPGSLAGNPLLDSWIRIGADGRVTVFTGKVELGQGILTAFRQIAAEELDVEPGRIEVISGDTGATPDEGTTAGSQSMQNGGTAIRYAAAEVRQILLEMAAEHLAAPINELSIKDGTVSGANGGSVTYAELVGGRRLEREATASVEPKGPERYAVVGRPLPRLDIPDKVFGRPAFVHDLRLPGMLHAKVVRPPSYAARLTDLDSGATEALPGVVTVVRDGSFLAVVAAREEQAIAAAERLRADAAWDEPQTLPRPEEMPAWLTSAASEDSIINDEARTGPAPSRMLEAEFYRPYQMHASIGPSAAVALYEDDRLTVYSHSQAVFGLQNSLAELLDIGPEQVRCIHREGAGCYGHNGADDAAADAALVARAVPGRPIRLQWSREDEHAWEPYGSAMVMRVRAGLGDDGRVRDWHYEVFSTPHSNRPGNNAGGLVASWHLEQPFERPPPGNIPQPNGGGDRNALALYAFDGHHAIKHFIPEMPLRVSSHRGLGAYANVFAIESFMDELAKAAGADPVAFRLDHLEDERARDVVRAAAGRFGWDGFERREGRGRGIAFARYKNLAAYCAVAVELEVEPDSGRSRVLRAVAGNDSGQIVNPDGIANQIEGGIVQSISWTLKEAVGFDGTRITTRDWSSYPILGFEEVPEIEVVQIDRPGATYLGTGEASQGPTVAAVANAVDDALGVRLRSLPLTPERVRTALG